MWVVPWLRRLDLAQAAFGRKRTGAAGPAGPTESEYVQDRLLFTPFPAEPVGWMIEQAGEKLFCFSSDYPHPEGTKDPIGLFMSVDGDAARRGGTVLRRQLRNHDERRRHGLDRTPAGASFVGEPV